MRRRSLFALTVVACTACAAPYPEPPPPGAAQYDRSFDAALGAANDTGIVVRSADRAEGRIRGTKSGVEVMIWLQWRPDGSTKIEFTPRHPAEDPKLGDTWLAAYERRMGR